MTKTIKIYEISQCPHIWFQGEHFGSLTSLPPGTKSSSYQTHSRRAWQKMLYRVAVAMPLGTKFQGGIMRIPATRLRGKGTTRTYQSWEYTVTSHKP
jgi:hypothetical protein